MIAFPNAAPPADASGAALAPQTRRELPPNPSPSLSLLIASDLAVVEAEWRRFEQLADCTAFQTFDWLATWQRHIGQRAGVTPAVVVGSYADGETAFILPLAVEPRRWTRRLCWLGQEQCDYNAPLLAPDFSQRVTPERFLAAWRELRERLQREPPWRHDWIELEKMPRNVGDALNPFMHLDVALNPSGTHLVHLGADWQTFYLGRRSAATRRRDRAKRKRISAFGDIRFVTAADQADARRTLQALMEQKGRALARKGIANMFARPGCRDFYLDLAANPDMRHLVHVSRVEVGTTCAAANLGVVFRDCYYHVLACYNEDSEVARYGPGALHLRELLAYAIGLRLKRFDFTIGDEPYKLEWSDTDLPLYDYAAAATGRGLASRWLSIPRRRIKRFIKQTPWAWRWASHARAAVGALSHPRLPRAQARGAKIMSAAKKPALACVMGDMDLLRPVALAGIPCAVVTRPGVPSLYSRAAQYRLAWDDFSKDCEQLVDALVAFGSAQPERPVLFYQEDEQLLLVSRFRERLAPAFRFVVAGAQLVEDLLDKARFQVLAQRLGLPVPAARRFNPAACNPTDLDLRFPIIVKPLTRLERWNDGVGSRKALAAGNPAALRALWPQLLALDIDLLAQELISGAEAQIESYHCYVDQCGGIAGEFSGRKIRTWPVCYGHTTALEITDAADVRRLGRTIVERLALTGIAKLDFKRDPQGNLHLLEINPRFNLWHHAGAVAGVNIPALVYADLVGIPRPAAAGAKAGIRWCRMWKDFPAARASGVPLMSWANWALGCEAKSSLAWDDPLPFLRSTIYRLSSGRIETQRAGAWHGHYRNAM